MKCIEMLFFLSHRYLFLHWMPMFSYSSSQAEQEILSDPSGWWHQNPHLEDHLSSAGDSPVTCIYCELLKNESADHHRSSIYVLENVPFVRTFSLLRSFSDLHTNQSNYRFSGDWWNPSDFQLIHLGLPLSHRCHSFQHPNWYLSNGSTTAKLQSHIRRNASKFLVAEPSKK